MELSSLTTVTFSGNVRSKVPLGPLTDMVKPSTETVTLSGIGTGFLPIRDIRFLLNISFNHDYQT
jgi:hypothetical protein